MLAGSEAGIPEAVAAWSRLDEDLNIDDFWTTRSLVELAEAQGVDVVVDVETLQDESVSDEEAEAFIRALGL